MVVSGARRRPSSYSTYLRARRRPPDTSRRPQTAIEIANRDTSLRSPRSAYDPELETPFWAYASWWVRQAMQQLASELSRPVVVPDRAARQLACVRTHAPRLRP